MTERQLHVLLIEDSHADRVLIEGLLARVRGSAFVLDHAASLAAGVACLAAGEFDGILLDLTLPDSHGLDSCTRIVEAAPQVPIVVLTGLDDEDLAAQALHRGAQDYLVKGRIDSDLLARSLRYAIERKRAEIALQQAQVQIERRKLQAELAHLARLHTTGEMASSMAHELNQPLTALVGYAESGIERLRTGELPPHELARLMTKIVHEAIRASEIIKRLRRLVRKREPERGPTDVNALVREVAEMVAFEAETRDKQLQLELDDRIPIVQADAIQIQQVLLNLVRNGFEAMEPTDAVHQPVIVRTALHQPDKIEIAVSDDGQGCPDGNIERLFDPYVSTKPHGLGMGLSISRSIIEAHGGRLWAVPNPTRGLTFFFTLPIAHGSS